MLSSPVSAPSTSPSPSPPPTPVSVPSPAASLTLFGLGVVVTGPMITSPVAPFPIPQTSSNSIKGAEAYFPGLTILTPIISPIPFITALPAPPDPAPPQKLTFGGPQSIAPVLHDPSITFCQITPALISESGSNIEPSLLVKIKSTYKKINFFILKEINR